MHSTKISDESWARITPRKLILKLCEAIFHFHFNFTFMQNNRQPISRSAVASQQCFQWIAVAQLSSLFVVLCFFDDITKKDYFSYQKLNVIPEEAITEVANLLMVVGSPTTAGRSNIQSFNGVKIFSEASPAGRPFCSHLFTFAWATLAVAPPGGGLVN